jgi:hypothetical protein
MAFNVQVAFTGICALVPNANENAAERMCIVLPDGRGQESGSSYGYKSVEPPSSSFGEQPLRRHQAFVISRVRDMYGGAAFSEELLCLWYLQRHKVTFRVEGAANPYQENLTTAANLGDVIPGYEFDQNIVGNSALRAVAQIFIDKGRLTGNPPQRSWVFPNTISQHIITGPLSDTVTLNLEDLDRFAVVTTSIENGDQKMWEFRPPNGGSVSLTIANLCDDNPLRWTRVSGQELLPDYDFQWYYELLTDEAKLRLTSSLLGLPFPVPHPLGQPNAQGINCLPAQVPPLSY